MSSANLLNNLQSSNNLLKMIVLKERLNKTDMEKVCSNVYLMTAMYQCILNVPLWNDLSKVTDS